MPLFYLVVTIDISRDSLASGYCHFVEPLAVGVRVSVHVRLRLTVKQLC